MFVALEELARRASTIPNDESDEAVRARKHVGELFDDLFTRFRDWTRRYEDSTSIPDRCMSLDTPKITINGKTREVWLRKDFAQTLVSKEIITVVRKATCDDMERMMIRGALIGIYTGVFWKYAGEK
jgi:hypothetical protein